MFKFLNTFKKKHSVSIGIGNNIDPKKRDGVIWCKSEKGIATKSFIADKPELLTTHDASVVESLFDQAIKIGLLPEYIEVFSSGYCRLYKYGYTSLPTFVGRV